eukprot:m51a1_g11096 putative endo- -beta-xylanase (530) ;mRNA; r:37643-40363
MLGKQVVLALALCTAAATVAAAESCTLSTDLKTAAARSGRYFGGCLSSGHMSDSKYLALADKHFSITTAENECKMDATEPSNGKFSFTACDSILSHAQAHNMKFRGHALVWHSQVPAWMKILGTAAAKKQAMIDHIKGVLAHYKGKVYAWDVVNEAVDDSGTKLRDKDSNWYPAISDFIDVAFTTARAADPSTKLFYNDYGADSYTSTKATYIYNMVKSMKQRGIPIDGVGFQMHLGTSWTVSEEDHRKNFQRFADLGLEVHLTELDVSSSGSSDWQKQAETYSRAAKACMAVSKCKSFEVWGVVDQYSWLGSAKTGLLWDSSYAAKPATCSVLNAFLAATPVAQSSSSETHTQKSSSGATPLPHKSSSEPTPQPKSGSASQAKSATKSNDEMPESTFNGVTSVVPATMYDLLVNQPELREPWCEANFRWGREHSNLVVEGCQGPAVVSLAPVPEAEGEPALQTWRVVKFGPLYGVESLAKDGTTTFGPPVPSPCLFRTRPSSASHELLLCKSERWRLYTSTWLCSTRR